MSSSNKQKDFQESKQLLLKIKDLKNELNKLKSEQVKLITIVESVPDGVLLFDIEGNIEYANQGIAKILELKDALDLAGRSLLDFTNTKGKQIILKHILPSLTGSGIWKGEIPFIIKNAEPREAESICVLVDDSQRNFQYVVAFFRDITNQKHLEDQLRQSQKMEAIGTLAGGVAHDMNNVLGAITNLATLVKLDMPHYDDHRQDIEDILSAAKRGRDLSRDLLGFARKGKYRKETVDINNVIEELKAIFIRTNPRAIELQLLLGDGISTIEGDYGQIYHALMNICINAADAIGKDDGKEGIITIATYVVTIDGLGLLVWPHLDAGKYLEIDIIDNGSGMSSRVLKKVFEPFFSTKAPGKGTGLGLSMVYGTIKNHKGDINIKSTVGAGTKITILLPIKETFEKIIKKKCNWNQKVSIKHTGELLLVDDEALVRRSGKRLLSRVGYKVQVAANGIEAMEKVKQNPDKFILMILDLIMPIMDGEKTFAKISTMEPSLPILISSGYSKDHKVLELLKKGAVGFVQKPFELQTIVNAIQKHSRRI